MLPQWHVKDTCHFAKSECCRLDLNTHTLPTQLCLSGLTVLSRHSVGIDQGKELTRNSSVNTRPQSSQLAKLLWTDPSFKSEIDVSKLISTGKEKGGKKKRMRGTERKNKTKQSASSKILASEQKLCHYHRYGRQPYVALQLRVDGTVCR